ncbi:MAG: CvpA family protein, partial [Patescibacteria group bacterium]|nr:CvpA family protein [Patescibacteria group bacterium]
IILIISLFALSGYYKGAIRQVGDFLSLLLAIFLSVRFYEPVGEYIARDFGIHSNFANLAAFFLVWVGVQLIFSIIFFFIYPLIPEKVRKSKINKFSGSVPGALWGTLFVALVISIIFVLPINSPYKGKVLESASGEFVTEHSESFLANIKDLASGTVDDALDFLTVKPNSGETVDLGFKVPESELSVDETAEEKMLELVNEERTSRGLKALVMDEKLRELARAHSKDMFTRGYFAHKNPDGEDPFDRMDRYEIEYRVAGENLALAPNVDLAHDGLMNSPGHRANILTDEYGHVGIGCIDGGAYGKMFSQEFTN